MANLVGLGAASWKRLELEDRAPKGEVLAQLVDMGFSADWLLTGTGQMRRDAHQPSGGPIDEVLLGEAIKLVDEWLTAGSRKMTAHRKAEIAAALYSIAMEDAEDGHGEIDRRRAAQILKLVV